MVLTQKYGLYGSDSYSRKVFTFRLKIIKYKLRWLDAKMLADKLKHQPCTPIPSKFMGSGNQVIPIYGFRWGCN